MSGCRFFKKKYQTNGSRYVHTFWLALLLLYGMKGFFLNLGSHIMRVTTLTVDGVFFSFFFKGWGV
jgi:hypothetical protein